MKASHEPFGPRGAERTKQSEVIFCGYCGHRPAYEAVGESRVCAMCELGLLLSAPEDAAPHEDERFLVVDDLLRVRAVSRGAERLFGLHETKLVERQIGEVLVPAEATPEGSARLAMLLSLAALGEQPATQTVAVRPSDASVIRYEARLALCRPGPAALIVLGERA